MKTYNFEQNTSEWNAARLGIPTASAFDKIITPGGAASKSSEDYANKLIAEIMSGKSAETFEGNKWTERGKTLEPDAIAFFEQTRNVTVERIGFATDDARTMGCSPDGLIGSDEVLEIKILSPGNHIAQLLNPKLDREHYPQVMGQLYVLNRKRVNILAYNPDIESVIMSIERDEDYIFKLATELGKFKKMLAEKKQLLISKGYLQEGVCQ